MCAYSTYEKENALQSIDILDKSHIENAFNGDIKIKQNIYNAFLQENESTSIDLTKAFSDLEMHKIKFITHKLKSSANAVGAKRLAEYANLLESFANKQDEESVLAMQNSFQSLLADTKQAIISQL